MKVILTTAAVIITLMGVLFMWGAFKYKAHFNTMKPIETGKIEANLFAIKDDFVNAYFFKSANGKYIAIDAGNSVESMAKELQKCTIPPSEVEAIFLTHTDYDHVGGIKLFPHAEVFISDKEEKMIDGTIYRGPFMKNSLDTPYTLLKDRGQVTAAGFKVQAVQTPGHTSGSTCYIVDDSLIFTGDLLKLENNKAQVFIPDFNIDTKKAEQSMKILKEFPEIRAVYTGHFGYTNNIEW